MDIKREVIVLVRSSLSAFASSTSTSTSYKTPTHLTLQQLRYSSLRREADSLKHIYN